MFVPVLGTGVAKLFVCTWGCHYGGEIGLSRAPRSHSSSQVPLFFWYLTVKGTVIKKIEEWGAGKCAKDSIFYFGRAEKGSDRSVCIVLYVCGLRVCIV